MSGVIDNESNVKFEYFTGAEGVAMAEQITSTEKWRLMQVRLHLSGASGVEDFTVQIDSDTGGVYDTVLLVRAMNGLTDYTFMFGDGSDGQILHKNDIVDFTYPNATAQIVWGLEVTWRSVGSG